jgi:hypothetical protein
MRKLITIGLLILTTSVWATDLHLEQYVAPGKYQDGYVCRQIARDFYINLINAGFTGVELVGSDTENHAWVEVDGEDYDPTMYLLYGEGLYQDDNPTYDPEDQEPMRIAVLRLYHQLNPGLILDYPAELYHSDLMTQYQRTGNILYPSIRVIGEVK